MFKNLNKTTLLYSIWLSGLFIWVSTYAFHAYSAAPFPQVKPSIYKNQQPENITFAVPEKKPDFSKPDLALLLTYGAPPHPLKKPMPLNDEPLSEFNKKLYMRIFDEQKSANWDRADSALSQLTDFRLRGHVLYQRFMHPTEYRSTFEELKGWLDLYHDHPNADKVYRLALARLPDTFEGALKKPTNRAAGISIKMDVLYNKGGSYVSPRSRTSSQRKDIKNLNRDIKRLLSKTAPTKAYQLLLEDPRAKLLDNIEYDQLRASIAKSYLLVGKLHEARELALASSRRSGNKAPISGWVAGMVAWRLNKYSEAAQQFELCASSPYVSPWTASAGAYWASRAHTRSGNFKAVSKWLRQAADHPRTFYGLIATRALGWDFDFNWEMPAFTDSHKEALNKIKAAYRAQALVDVKEFHLAEAELLQVNPGNNILLREALISYANYAGLPSYSMRLASAFSHPAGGFYDAALYPIAPWEPSEGFKVDLALIHALIRQESRFNPTVESHSGAMGLMQLMPSTASFVSGKSYFKKNRNLHKLKDPHTNINIGQQYIEHLLYEKTVNFDLFSLAAAYNAGPGNLRRWKSDMPSIRDPLLFVESIPIAETRAFIERVMANYWVYRIRLGQDTPSLDSVTQGDWAKYVSLDYKMGSRKDQHGNLARPIPQQKPFKLASGSLN